MQPDILQRMRKTTFHLLIETLTSSLHFMYLHNAQRPFLIVSDKLTMIPTRTFELPLSPQLLRMLSVALAHGN